MELISYEQWTRWLASRDGGVDYTLLPFVRKLVIDRDEAATPLFWDRFWQDASAYACLLESGKGGRYTVAGLTPVSAIEGKGDRARVLESDGDGGWPAVSESEGEPLRQVRQWMQGWTSPKPEGLPDCVGGAIGLWSYDIVRSLERLPVLAADDSGIPDYVFLRFEELWIVDHQEHAVYCAVHVPVAAGEAGLVDRYEAAGRRAAMMESQWRGWAAISDEPSAWQRHREMLATMAEDQLQIDVESLPGLTTSMTKAEYEQAVRRIQAYIAQGDVFQVNLAVRQSRPVDVPPESLYEWLRLVNPSPYMGMLRTPSFALVSASPELLVKLDGGKLSTRPIAGTRRRGRTPEEDRALEDELLGSEKERAEHVMLVDLERNDLGRVSEYGSVKVPELMTVERYSHVMHLVSQVEGRIARGKDAFDVLAAVFPGGTITGAPKIRTMEIIEELEPTRRGPYTGSLGWIDYSGNMEFNIIIRTIAMQEGVCHIQAGAGIVIDSVPEREFYESLNKAKALWKAVQYGERWEEKPL
ncbi:anthranilate synthase component I family protein [Cohnella panacarvi]|uniref:anthranilate synthase component I family protein n=1 Tax=Cohnella panacarvi TaxID=400776 RepID=UPI00047D0935|nr:anthranilate synthase component I family protein [Cohnella panacarvi]